MTHLEPITIELHLAETMDVENLDVTYHYYQEDLKIDTVELNGENFIKKITESEFNELLNLVEAEHLSNEK